VQKPSCSNSLEAELGLTPRRPLLHHCLDIFVGNAGAFGFLPLTDVCEDKLDEAFDELFAVNVKGYVMGAKAALPELQKAEGCMVFTASVAGFNSGGGGGRG